MPKPTEPRKRIDTKLLLKVAAENGFNNHATARALGISPQAVQKRMAKEYVKKTFDQIMDKVGLTDDFIATGLIDGCRATHRDSFPDLPTRHKYYNTVLEVRQHIKRSNNAPAVSIININYGYRGKDSEPRPLRDGRERQRELS